MCGRFSQANFTVISEQFGVRESGQVFAILKDEPRYNIAPTQVVVAITVADDGVRELTPLKWGLVPSWAKEDKGGAKLINAKAETVAELPSSRSAFRRRRCVIPASAFYEWRRSSDKQPFAIRGEDGEPLAFAGLWEVWRPKDAAPGTEPLRTCTILTTSRVIPN